MKQVLLILILGFLPTILFSQHLNNDTIQLFFLGGQSNMDGYGKNSELPDSLMHDFKDVWIFHGNPVADEKENGGLGKWDVLKPGHGTGFRSDGARNYMSDRFGVELSFAKKLQKLYPHQKIAIIKYSRGGTSIDSMAAGKFGSWELDYKGKNGVNQFDNFLVTIKEAFKADDIDRNGQKDVLVPSGIIWMQGESDANFTEEIASRYYDNLKRLMDVIRVSFLKDDIAVVIGKISDSWRDTDGKVWDYGEIVHYAQEKYAKTDKNAAIVRSTRYYGYSDTWHYDSKGYIDLGEQFANAVFKLNSK